MTCRATCLLAFAAVAHAGGPGSLPLLLAAPAAVREGTPVSAPALITAGMKAVLASVPAQAGATYQWTVDNGTLVGTSANAAVYFNAPAEPGTVTPTCRVTVGGVTSVYTRSLPVVAPLTPTPVWYGSGWSADALANTVVGGPTGNVVSYRFQAQQSQVLEAIRIFFIWSTTKAGYASGLGGTVRVDLMGDDGSASHLPGGPVLATVSYGSIIPQNNYYPRLTFPLPAQLTAGSLYHLVFTNVDPDPANNWISLDTLWTDAATAPMQPVLPDPAFAVLFRTATGAWRLRQGFTPTLGLYYTSATQGNGYMEVWSTNPKPISGPAAVREVFTVSGPSRTFSSVNVRLQRTAGEGPLTVSVEEGDGTLVEAVEVPASAVLQGVPAWIQVPFTQAHALNSGVAYHLVLTAPAGTTYAAFPIRKGLDKGFTPAMVFPDGYAQFTTSAPGGWTGWDMWGTPNLTFSDLQFAFVP